MSIPESKFEDWKGTGADTGSSLARNRIDRTLRMDRSPAEQSEGSYEVRLQGSYKNDTHTWGSSDVDIIVKLTSAWRRDLSNLSSSEESHYHDENSPADYGYSEFRDDIYNWLSRKFDGVSFGSKAIAIDSDQTTKLDVDVDIVPCIEYRVYQSYPIENDSDVVRGMSFDDRSTGESIVNYPTLHYQNGCDKHSNYKETVRIFKNARDYYNEHWNSIWSIDAPSYFIECLIYNIPEQILKRSSRSQRFDEVLEYLEDGGTDLSSFTQVSEMELLFGNSNTQWDLDSAETMVTRLRELWDDWYDQHNAQLFN